MVHFVVLCGGSGSRLWPKSREKLPKQFLSLTNEFTMLQNTVQRLLFLETSMKKEEKEEKNKLLIVCNKEHTHIVENQLKELSLVMEYHIVSEPIGRDSAPAICISALLGSPYDISVVLPCDHVMDQEEFTRCCIQSLNYTENSIVTFGIQPTHPEIGYGYIQTNPQLETIQFVEKPNLETAKKYIQEGNYLWNAGIFVFQNKKMLQCFEKYAPDILNQCTRTIKESVFTHSTMISLNESSFSRCRAISVDYAIMEKLCSDEKSPVHKITIPYQSYWNDIGSYLALYEQLEKDRNQNVLKGDVWTMDTRNTYVESEKGMVATIGVENLIIVNTEDALLVCTNDKTQEVKKIVEYLKKEKREEYILHKKVYRPWGYYVNVEGKDDSGFKIKTITVYPGKRLSLQSHQFRSEHWVMVRGKAKVQVGAEEMYLEKDQHVYIPIQTLHRIENVGEELLEFTETQIGDYLEEDDIVRYEDDFGRV